MKKYELTNETITIYDKTLYRIKSLKDFGNVKAGDYGGFVESERNLSHQGDCWVYYKAQVYRDARVYGNALVYGNAKVSGNARVYDNARVYGNAFVYGNAKVSGNAFVYGNARVYGKAWVSGDAKVYGDARVFGNAKVGGDAKVGEFLEESETTFEEHVYMDMNGELVVVQSNEKPKVNGYEYLGIL